MSEEVVKQEVQAEEEKLDKSAIYSGMLFLALVVVFAVFGILQIPFVKNSLPYIRHGLNVVLYYGLELLPFIIRCAIIYLLMMAFYKKIVRVTVKVWMDEMSKTKK